VIDYENILSEKVKSIKFSGIRKFFDIAASMDNIISLSVGEPDFKTPFTIRKAAIRTLEKGKTAYTANAGMAELRQEIAGYLKDRINVEYDPAHEIIVTVGGSEAIDVSFRAILNDGDEVLIPATRNIDIVLGGHTHSFFEQPKVYRNADGKEVLLQHIGKQGTYMSKTELKFQGE